LKRDRKRSLNKTKTVFTRTKAGATYLTSTFAFVTLHWFHTWQILMDTFWNYWLILL